jgi:hypothetical protein
VPNLIVGEGFQSSEGSSCTCTLSFGGRSLVTKRCPLCKPKTTTWVGGQVEARNASIAESVDTATKAGTRSQWLRTHARTAHEYDVKIRRLALHPTKHVLTSTNSGYTRLESFVKLVSGTPLLMIKQGCGSAPEYRNTAKT